MELKYFLDFFRSLSSLLWKNTKLLRGIEYNMGKKEKGSNNIFTIILRLLGRISSLKEGKGTETLRRIVF